MKFEINIEKKYLIFFGVFVLLVVGGYAIAVNDPNVFHEVLYTDRIKPHSFLSRMELNAASGTSNPFFFLVNYDGSNEVDAVTMGFDGNRNVIVKHNLAVEGKLCPNRNSPEIDCKSVSEIINQNGGNELPPLTIQTNNLNTIDIGHQNLNDYCADGDGCFYRIIYIESDNDKSMVYGDLIISPIPDYSGYNWYVWSPSGNTNHGELGDNSVGIVTSAFTLGTSGNGCAVYEGDSSSDSIVTGSSIKGTMTLKKWGTTLNCKLIIYD